jgi:hypothetical protein
MDLWIVWTLALIGLAVLIWRYNDDDAKSAAATGRGVGPPLATGRSPELTPEQPELTPATTRAAVSTLRAAISGMRKVIALPIWLISGIAFLLLGFQLLLALANVLHGVSIVDALLIWIGNTAILMIVAFVAGGLAMLISGTPSEAATARNEGVFPNPREGTWASPGYRSARTRARWAQVLVGIAAAIYVIGAITGVNELSLLDRIIGGSATDSEVASFLRFTDSLNSLSILVMFISAIAVFAWLSRTVEIVPPLGGGTPRRSPREAIGWWFVPIASFVIPYQIVRDVHRRLETPTRRGGDRTILAWWLLFIIGGLVTRATGIAMDRATTVDAVRNVEMTGIAALVATSVGGFLFVRIIGEIESRSTERAVSLSLRDPEALWPGSVTSPRTSAAAAVTPALPPVVDSPGSNVEARLATLERLRSTGAISADEYAARRNKILDEI